MKNFFKTLIFAVCLISVGACEDDIDPIATSGGFSLRSTNAQSLTLIPQDDAAVAVNLSWDKSANGPKTTVSDYTIEVAESGTNFANPVLANGGNIITGVETYSLTVRELNAIVLQFSGYQCGQALSADIRVKSVLGDVNYNSLTQYSSNTISVSVTPYSLALPLMSFSSDAQSAATASRVAASGILNTDYEGYMYLQPGSYKFYKADGCGQFVSPIVYGDNGSGVLAVNGGAYQVTTAAFYYVTADLGTGVFAVRPVTWNVFGAAKPLLQNVNTAMLYDQTTKLWSVTTNLYVAGKFKFRSNVNAAILGTYNPATINTPLFAGNTLSYYVLTGAFTGLTIGGDLTLPGASTTIPVVKSFTITLDLNTPRSYTYTATQNN